LQAEAIPSSNVANKRLLVHRLIVK
jgi:hypothetical protein